MNESYTAKGTVFNFEPTNAWVSTRVEIDISDQTLDRLAKIFSPVQHGYWVETDDGDCCYKCSECGFLRDAYILDVGNYCPHCGAQMNKERKEK